MYSSQLKLGGVYKVKKVGWAISIQGEIVQLKGVLPPGNSYQLFEILTGKKAGQTSYMLAGDLERGVSPLEVLARISAEDES